MRKVTSILCFSLSLATTLTLGCAGSNEASETPAAGREQAAREKLERLLRPLYDARLLAENAVWRAVLGVKAAVKLFARSDGALAETFGFVSAALTTNSGTRGGAEVDRAVPNSGSGSEAGGGRAGALSRLRTSRRGVGSKAGGARSVGGRPTGGDKQSTAACESTRDRLLRVPLGLPTERCLHVPMLWSWREFVSMLFRNWTAASALLLGIAAVAPTLSGCGSEDEAPSTPQTDSDRWADLRYIDKVARTLRQGRGLSPDDDVDALTAMTPEQVVDHFMADPSFNDTVLDYNLYFLGLKTSSVRSPGGTLSQAALFSRRAVNSALAAKRGGDYLSLLSLQQTPFMLPPTPPALPDPTVPPASDVEARQYWLTQALSEADALIALGESGASKEELCGALLMNTAFSPIFPGLLGLNDDIGLLLVSHPNWFGPFFFCFAAEIPVDITAVTHKLRAKLPELHAFVEETVAQGTRTLNTLDDLQESDLKRLDIEDATRRLELVSFWFNLPNSSTNYNRRRAAYMLDRFFCDDLKPINAALPEAHSGDHHASDPGCASCHYKLDPMAGFFKEYGVSGMDFSIYDTLLFDDAAVMDKSTYQAGWTAAPGSGRKWDIGYIRSSTDASQNVYGESLDDLFHIIQTAPEVKACMVRRTFEYFNGDEQLVDPGYLAHLTDLFAEEAQGNSTAALKGLVRRILTGNTFRSSDPRSDKCYDLAPGVEPSSRPPCDVAFLLQKNCASCHSGANSQADLDLTGWTTDAGGWKTFPQRTGAGAQRPAAETFAALLDRITTSDPKRSMPLGRSMSSKDREALFLWVDSQVSRLGGAP